MEIQDAKQARPHCELIAELLDSRQPKTEREHAAVREIERLRHDIERHIAIASEHATECERLRAELSDAYAEVHKQVAVSKVIFDRALVNRAKASLATPSEERKP